MKRLIAIIALCAVFPAFADDDAVTTKNIGARMTCDEIAAEIAKLSADENADADKLAQLQMQHRKNCAKRAMGRRNNFRGAPAPAETEPETDTDTVEITYVAPTPEPVVDTPTDSDELTDAEIANLQAGLCRDGARPNKFGCCAGEKFMEISNLEFACCPERGECYPPIGK